MGVPPRLEESSRNIQIITLKIKNKNPQKSMKLELGSTNGFMICSFKTFSLSTTKIQCVLEPEDNKAEIEVVLEEKKRQFQI